MDTAIVLSFAVDLAVKSSAIVLIAWLATWAWRQSSASQKVYLWGAAFALLAALPFTRLVAPHWALAWPASPAPGPIEGTFTQASDLIVVASHATPPLPPVGEGMTIDGMSLLAGLWISGVGGLIAYRALGAIMLRRFHRTSSSLKGGRCMALAASIKRDLGINRPVDIRVSGNIRVPVTWGTRKPVALLPSEALAWPEVWLESALRHELGHVKNRDHVQRLLAFLICAFYWPNPLVWMAARKLQLAQEEASDNLVLGAGVSPQGYASQLLEVIQSAAPIRGLPLPAVMMARRSTLEGRLSAILDDRRNRESSSRQLGFATLTAAIIAASALTAIQLRAADPSVPVANPSPASPAAPAVDPFIDRPDNSSGRFMIQKLKSIVLDSVDFNKADVADVLQFFEKKSRELDPDKKGISFVLEDITPQDLAGSPADHRWPIRRLVSITLEHVPLDDLLGYVVQQTNLKCSIEGDTVYFMPTVDESHERISRVFIVPADFLRSIPPVNSPPGTDPIDVKDSLTRLGFYFPEGSSAVFRPKTNQLEVHDTKEQMRALIKFLVKLDPRLWKDSPAHTPPAKAAPTTELSPPALESRAAALQHKLDTILINEISFDQADLGTLIQALTVKSKEADPDKVGINFVLNMEGYVNAVSLHMKNVPLRKVLDAVVSQAGIQYAVDDDAVYLRPGTVTETLSVRTYAVPPHFFAATPPAAVTPSISAAQPGPFFDVHDQLAQRGIQFPAGATAVLVSPDKLVVRDTPQQLDLLETLIERAAKEATTHPFSIAR